VLGSSVGGFAGAAGIRRPRRSARWCWSTTAASATTARGDGGSAGRWSYRRFRGCSTRASRAESSRWTTGTSPSTATRPPSWPTVAAVPGRRSPPTADRLLTTEPRNSHARSQPTRPGPASWERGSAGRPRVARRCSRSTRWCGPPVSQGHLLRSLPSTHSYLEACTNGSHDRSAPQIEEATEGLAQGSENCEGHHGYLDGCLTARWVKACSPRRGRTGTGRPGGSEQPELRRRGRDRTSSRSARPARRARLRLRGDRRPGLRCSRWTGEALAAEAAQRSRVLLAEYGPPRVIRMPLTESPDLHDPLGRPRSRRDTGAVRPGWSQKTD